MQIRDLFFQEGDEKDVITKLGRIDLLTNSHLVEFKSFNDFYDALGKVLCYHSCYKKIWLKPAIVLFGRCEPEKLFEFNKVTALYGTDLHFYDGSKESLDYINHAIHNYDLGLKIQDCIRISEDIVL